MLTYREFQVLTLLAHGNRNKQIAEALHVSHLTVKNHIYKIYRKLDVQNRTQATVKYMRGEYEYEPNQRAVATRTSRRIDPTRW